MAHIFKSLMNDIKTKLDASSDVTSLLLGGADNIHIMLNEQSSDFVNKPKPFINITPVSDVQDVNFESSRHRLITVAITYIKDDQPETTQTGIFDDGEKIEAVLLGDNLKNPVYDTEKTFRQEYSAEYPIEGGLMKILYELVFTYYQNK